MRARRWDRTRVEHVATALRRCRLRRGTSQERLGIKAGVARTYVGRVERRLLCPTLLSMGRLLDALDVTWAEFGAVLDEEVVRPATPPRRRR